MSKSITHELYFPVPPEMVWPYLTDSTLLSEWLMKNDFQPIVGHSFQFRASPMPNFNFNGIIDCQVLDLIPNQKLSYTWKGGANDGSIGLDSIVCWTLEPSAGGTILKLVHSGFKEISDITMHQIMNLGWKKNIQKILDLIQQKNANSEAS